jgi:hypothetical protein
VASARVSSIFFTRAVDLTAGCLWRCYRVSLLAVSFKKGNGDLAGCHSPLGSLDLSGANDLLGGNEMSTEQDVGNILSEQTLYRKLFIAFREAKEDGLSWRDCYGLAEDANAEVFPDADIEAKREQEP